MGHRGYICRLGMDMQGICSDAGTCLVGPETSGQNSL